MLWGVGAQTRLLGPGFPGCGLRFGYRPASAGSLARSRSLSSVPWAQQHGACTAPAFTHFLRAASCCRSQSWEHPSELCWGAGADSLGGRAPNENVITQMERALHPAPSRLPQSGCGGESAGRSEGTGVPRGALGLTWGPQTQRRGEGPEGAEVPRTPPVQVGKHT